MPITQPTGLTYQFSAKAQDQKLTQSRKLPSKADQQDPERSGKKEHTGQNLGETEGELCGGELKRREGGMEEESRTMFGSTRKESEHIHCISETESDDETKGSKASVEDLLIKLTTILEDGFFSCNDVEFKNICSPYAFRHMIEHILEEMGPKYEEIVIPYAECDFIQNIVEKKTSFRFSQALLLSACAGRDFLCSKDLSSCSKILQRHVDFYKNFELSTYQSDNFDSDTAKKPQNKTKLREEEAKQVEINQTKWKRLREKRNLMKKSGLFIKKKKTRKRPSKREREERKRQKNQEINDTVDK